MEHQHYSSSQKGVVVNNDPALDIAHEHPHGHLHHSAHAVDGREDNVTYSTGTTGEKSINPHQDPMDHALHRRQQPEHGHGIYMKEKEAAIGYDAEKGSTSPYPEEEKDPKEHKVTNFYLKYKIFFHAFIWLLFTG